MKLNQLKNIILNKGIKTIYIDYFDSLVHRTVHPNQVQRIWSKIMIRELGLNCSTDQLYFIRKESTHYLKTELDRDDVEVLYEDLKREVLKRVINLDILSQDQAKLFLGIFEVADLKAEMSTQYLNENVVSILKSFKDDGGDVYLISDFYGPVSLFEKMLGSHGILHLFNGLFSSSTQEKSKYNGTIYKDVIEITKAEPRYTLMIGDNKVSDGINAAKSNLNTYILPHKKQLRKNKRNNIGNDKKQFNRIISKIYKACRKNKSIPFTEYILFYHLFVEQLYYRCKQNQIKDLFFLSREGLYLKKLFDSYQDHVSIDGITKVNTHYLRISRQSSLQITLKGLDDEDFTYLKANFDELSVLDFLNTFGFNSSKLQEITASLTHDSEEKHASLFDSKAFLELKNHSIFVDYYNASRHSNKTAFDAYIKSFNVDIHKDGLTLVDIGWGGTMQESLYKFFGEDVNVTGYYLGLKEIYNLTPKTKRFGLNFSILPYIDYDDYILMANTQLYEQFLSAHHGSPVGYKIGANEFTIEHHQPKEKWLYDNYIENHQTIMFEIHKSLLSQLDTVCYSQPIVKRVLSKKAMRTGLFLCSKRLKFLESLNDGFYQNIGDNQVGVKYDVPEVRNIKKKTLKFLLKPEYFFRFIVKVKPVLCKKNKVLAFFFPTYIFYLYYNFNRYIRFKVLNKYFLLRYNFFK